MMDRLWETPSWVKMFRKTFCMYMHTDKSEFLFCDIRVCLLSVHEKILCSGGLGQNSAGSNLSNRTFNMFTHKCIVTNFIYLWALTTSNYLKWVNRQLQASLTLLSILTAVVQWKSVFYQATAANVQEANNKHFMCTSSVCERSCDLCSRMEDFFKIFFLSWC